MINTISNSLQNFQAENIPSQASPAESVKKEEGLAQSPSQDSSRKRADEPSEDEPKAKRQKTEKQSNLAFEDTLLKTLNNLGAIEDGIKKIGPQLKALPEDVLNSKKPTIEKAKELFFKSLEAVRDVMLAFEAIAMEPKIELDSEQIFLNRTSFIHAILPQYATATEHLKEGLKSVEKIDSQFDHKKFTRTLLPFDMLQEIAKISHGNIEKEAALEKLKKAEAHPEGARWLLRYQKDTSSWIITFADGREKPIPSKFHLRDMLQSNSSARVVQV